MSEEYVWVTDAHIDARLTKGFDYDRLVEEKDAVLDALSRHEKGQFVDKSEFPPVMWTGIYDSSLKKTPNLFKGGGFWTVTTEFADVLRQFDLGNSELHPVELFRRNKKTPLEGSHEFLSCCEVKDGFEASYSQRFDLPSLPATTPCAYLPLAPKDFEISVNASVLSGPDIWFDTFLVRCFFFSDRLVQALKAAKLTSRLRLFKVRVIRNA